MALFYLAWDLLALEERVQILERRIERRILRDSQNPYDRPRNEFLNMFRD